VSISKFISTDPPYYDNIGYADLSDFFYVWLRKTLRETFLQLLATMAVPKAEELVATPYRHGGKEKAEHFFLNGMTDAMRSLSRQAHPAGPITIYYAFQTVGYQSGFRNFLHRLGDLSGGCPQSRIAVAGDMAFQNRTEQPNDWFRYQRPRLQRGTGLPETPRGCALHFSAGIHP
jgi:hypothetical protein